MLARFHSGMASSASTSSAGSVTLPPAIVTFTLRMTRRTLSASRDNPSADI
jgi:hypothetical protein